MAVKQNTITNGLEYSLITGNWGDQKKSMQTKAFVSQVLNPHCPTYDVVTRLQDEKARSSNPINYTVRIGGWCVPPKHQRDRLVDPSKIWSSWLSVGSYSEEGGLEQLEEIAHSQTPLAKVFINGVWMGVHRNLAGLVEKIRELPLVQWNFIDVTTSVQKYLSFVISERRSCDYTPMLIVCVSHCSLWRTGCSCCDVSISYSGFPRQGW